MKYLPGAVSALGLMILSLCSQSCGDTIDLGADLLQTDELAIGFTDTLSLYTGTSITDSVQTFYYNSSDLDNAITPSVYPVGIMDDPIFGRSEAEFYIQYLIAGATPDFKDAVLDSAIVTMAYDTAGLYGDISSPITLELHRMVDKLDATRSYYSNQKLSYEGSAAAVLANFVPAPRDSILSIDTTKTPDDTVKLRPHIRFQVDAAIAQEILNADPSVFASNTTFTEFFKGFAVLSSQPGRGMLSFNPIWQESSNRVSKFTLFYHKDGVARNYEFQASSVSPRSVYFSKDYSGSAAGNYLNDPILSQEYTFLQGHAGLRTEVELPDLSKFKENGILNYGELEFALALLPGDDTATYKAVRQVVVSEKLSDGSLRVIDDYILALSKGALNVFGGSPVSGTQNDITYQRYRLNISTHLHKVLKGSATRKLVITVAAPAERANRVVLCGPKHPTYPARLKLAFSTY